jgi:hypothetical protein
MQPIVVDEMTGASTCTIRDAGVGGLFFFGCIIGCAPFPITHTIQNALLKL